MLRAGLYFTLAGTRFRVAYVNACRAHCVATAKRVVTVTDHKGRVRSFLATSRRTLDISPDTDLKVLGELETGRRRPVFR